jgi:hypothetical protein
VTDLGTDAFLAAHLSSAPTQAVDGPIPSVDAFIELLLVVDVSPAAAAAAEAAAAPQPRLPPAPRLAPPPGSVPFSDAGAGRPLSEPQQDVQDSRPAVCRPAGRRALSGTRWKLVSRHCISSSVRVHEAGGAVLRVAALKATCMQVEPLMCS